MASVSDRTNQHGRVMVVGSANMDLVFRTSRFPLPGETVLGDSFATFPGGKGANQAVASSKLFPSVAFVGKVGADSFGDALAESMAQSGVDVGFLLRSDDMPTGTAAILVDPNGQNCIVAAPGANSRLLPSEVRDAFERIEPTVVLTQLETPIETVVAAGESAVGKSMFILNPAPACEVPDALLATVDLITPNETETEFLTGVCPTDDASCLVAAGRLFDRGAKAVLITLGAKGSFYANTSGGRHYPTLNVRAIDTTAAGDAFNGALATFLAEGRELENAILLANCVGALSTTKAGAQASMPSREELAEVADRLL